jgi:hypothetical protein
VAQSSNGIGWILAAHSPDPTLDDRCASSISTWLLWRPKGGFSDTKADSDPVVWARALLISESFRQPRYEVFECSCALFRLGIVAETDSIVEFVML